MDVGQLDLLLIMRDCPRILEQSVDMTYHNVVKIQED